MWRFSSEYSRPTWITNSGPDCEHTDVCGMYKFRKDLIRVFVFIWCQFRHKICCLTTAIKWNYIKMFELTEWNAKWLRVWFFRSQFIGKTFFIRKSITHILCHWFSIVFANGKKRMRFPDSLAFSVQLCVWEALTVKQNILCTGHNNNVENSIQRVKNRLKTDKVNAKCSRLSSGNLYSWVRDQHEML